MGPDPAVAAVRRAVRHELDVDVDIGSYPVIVACSGGADSLALLAATAFGARKRKWQVVGVTVDHGLQNGSADRAAVVTRQMAALGAAETVSLRVEVTTSGSGVEAAAREARYAALDGLAERVGSGVVLLGHTLDDQAETVLLGLARGSGPRSLGGMRSEGLYRRPLLGVTRAQTEAACRAEGIEFWEDPHNADVRFTRARIRHRVLPVLETELGPGIAAALARTADALQQDADALDELSEQVRGEAACSDGGLDAARLETEPAAISSRVLRRAAIAAGCPPTELFRVHVVALGKLVSEQWPRRARPAGGSTVQLPGHVTAYLEGDRLRFRRTENTGDSGSVGG